MHQRDVGGTTRREGFLKIERNPFNASIFDASTLKQAGPLSSSLPEFSVFHIPVSIPPTSLKSNPTTVHNTHIYIPIHTTVGRTCQPHFSRLFAFFPSPSPIFLTHSPSSSSSSYILPVLLSRTPGCSAASWSHNNLPAHHESLPGFGFPRLSSERFQKGRQRPSRYRFVENLLRHLATHPSLFILRVSLVQRTGKNLSRNSLYLARSFVTRSIGWRILRYLPSFLLFVPVAGMLILKSVSRIRIEEWKVSG